MLRVTPIYGSRWSPEGSANESSCCFVEYGGCRVLWNVGQVSELPELPPHDAVIVTSSSMEAAGGLPLYYQHYQDKPIYATYPTVKMGQMTLYDHHAAVCLDGNHPNFSLEDVDRVFGAIQSIKYSQAMTLFVNHAASLKITAHRAGHVVGGAFFVLQRLVDETNVVLTSDYQVAKELHLDSTTLLQYGSTPDVLVTHPGGPTCRFLHNLAHGNQSALAPKLVSQLQRTFLDTVLATLRRDGNVLVPVDAAGRVLELLLLLNRFWERQRLGQTYNLCWAAPMAQNVLEFARSQLEWMNPTLTKDDAPLALKHVQIVTSVSQVLEFTNPTIVLASGTSLDAGPARTLLLEWADNPENAIVFTDSRGCVLRSTVPTATTEHVPDATTTTTTTTIPTTLTADVTATDTAAPVEESSSSGDGGGDNVLGARVDTPSTWTAAGQLLVAWATAQLSEVEMDDSLAIDLPVPHRQPLAGNELKTFLANEEEAKRQEKILQEKLAMLREIELAKGQLRLGEQPEGGTSVPEPKTSIVAPRPKKKSRFDSSLFLKFSKPLHLMFEVREEAVGIGQIDSVAKYGIGESVGRSGEVLEDDYGIAVIPEKFTDIVSGVDPAKLASGTGRIGDDVLRRGLGYAGGDSRRSTTGKGSASAGAAAARVSEDEDVEDDDVDESAIEAIDLSDGKGIIRGRNGRPPTKVTTFYRNLEVFAEVFYVPLEGRVDARAARQSVRALQPRQVVVLGGPDVGEPAGNLVDEVSLLAKAAFAFATDKKPIETPSDGETVELEIGHAAYAVRLVDVPYQSRKDKEADLEPPRPLELYEASLGSCAVSLLDYVATGKKVALDGSIVLAPRAQTDDVIHGIYLSDGEVLLTDLRSELIAAGMKAEYSAHSGYQQLIVNGKIIVKRPTESGDLEIEGPLCEDFYKVRSIVGGQFIVL